MAEKLTNVVNLPSPHGGTLVERILQADPREYEHLPALELDAQGYADLELHSLGQCVYAYRWNGSRYGQAGSRNCATAAPPTLRTLPQAIRGR